MGDLFTEYKKKLTMSEMQPMKAVERRVWDSTLIISIFGNLLLFCFYQGLSTQNMTISATWEATEYYSTAS